MLVTACLTAYYAFRLYLRVFEGPEVIPTSPAEGHHAAVEGTQAESHSHASASAVMAGDTAESGVDEHLSSATHQMPVEDHGHQVSGRADHPRNHEPAIMIVPLI